MRGAPLQDARRLVGARGVDEERELVEVGLGFVDSRRWDGHADEDDLLPDGAFDQAHATCASTVATWTAGPVSVTVSSPSSTTAAPPGW